MSSRRHAACALAATVAVGACGSAATTTTTSTVTPTTSPSGQTSALPASGTASAGAAGSTSTAHAEEDTAHWGYEGSTGPTAWASLDPANAACGTGRAQSPIDLTGETARDLPDLAPAYVSFPLTVWNNGHTVQVPAAAGSRLVVGDRTSALVQLHLHTPSEHLVDGAPAQGELHLVHKDAEGRLSVVGVLLTEGSADNAAFAPLVDNLPSDEGEPAPVSGATLDPSALLPASLGYRTYAGSLTTPPCTEGVTWYVLDTPVQLSEEQLEQLREVMGANARPVQPIHDRALVEDSSA